MLVKFFARGKGEGRGPVEYITRKNYPGTNKLRYPAPELIRGNPVITRRLIDSLLFKHKYNSGVLSFAPEDAPTDKQIEAVVDSFERYAFAGLDKTATTDFRVNPETDSRDNNYTDRQRNISNPAELLDSNSWLAMPGKTLSEIGVGVEDERTGKQTDDRFREASRAIQAGHDQFVPQIQHGHEAVRKAELAANSTSDSLKQSSQELERANREAKDIQQQIDLNLQRVRVALKQKKAKQLERFKTEINLVEYATSMGYEYLRDESSPSRAVLRHGSGDLIVVVTDTGDRGVYFSLKDSDDNGTIIDLVQRRRNLNLGEVRKELRPWLSYGDEPKAPLRDRSNYNIAKPEPMNKDKINECLICLKNLNQLSPQQPQPPSLGKPKPKQKKRGQLEP